MNASFVSKGALLIACAVTAPIAQAITLYTESFAPFSDADLNSYGWWNRAYEHASTNYYNNNEWQPVAVAAGGYIYGGGGGGNNDYLTYSTEYVIDRSQYNNLQLTWTNSANDPINPSFPQGYRAVVRLGGQWYATTNAQQGQTSTLTFDIDDNMSLLAEVPGAIGQSASTRGFVLGAAALLPAGNIDAFGILLQDQKGDVRYYSPTVTGDVIPEPASVAGASVALAVFSSRRRRN